MRYYQIVPLVKIALKTKPFFTYHSVLMNLKNSLVEIPFGNKKVKGAVLKEIKKPLFPTKEILKIVEEKFFTNNQIKLAEKISDYYLTNLGTVLKFFVFKRTKKISSINLNQNKKTADVQLTLEQSAAYKKISLSRERKFLLYGPASSGKTEVAMRLIKDTLKNKKQSLVIIPEIFLSYHEIRRYQERFIDKKVVLLHSGLKPAEVSAIWKNCKEGEIDIVISTKIGLFLPFKNLGLIIIDEEQDISHKQWDLSPRYHSRKVASSLSDIFKTKLVYMSATPSLEILHQFSDKKIIKLPMLKKGKLIVNQPEIRLIDTRKYFFQKNTSQIFSEEARKVISDNLQKKKLTFVLVTRRGKSRITVCVDCKKILLCQKCETPLIQIGDNYRCLHCSFKQPSFSCCPYCKSFRLKNIGMGTEKAAVILTTLFPSANIRLADQTIFLQNSERERLFNDISKNKVDILVGTQSIVKGFNFPRLNLAIIVDAESWSGKSDFKHDERWLGNLFQIAGRVNRPGSSQQGQVIVQTCQKENPFYVFLLNWNWLEFAREELKNRQTLGFPPFTKLIKLTCQNISLKKTEECVKNKYEEALKMKLNITEPYWGFNKKIRGKYEKNILLKLRDFDCQNVKKLVENLKENWRIDIDPENIF